MMLSVKRLLCAECERESDEHALGWRAYLAGGLDGEEGEVEEALVFCPACAKREFGGALSSSADGEA